MTLKRAQSLLFNMLTDTSFCKEELFSLEYEILYQISAAQGYFAFGIIHQYFVKEQADKYTFFANADKWFKQKVGFFLTFSSFQFILSDPISIFTQGNLSQCQKKVVYKQLFFSKKTEVFQILYIEGILSKVCSVKLADESKL